MLNQNVKIQLFDHYLLNFNVGSMLVLNLKRKLGVQLVVKTRKHVVVQVFWIGQGVISRLCNQYIESGSAREYNKKVTH